MCGTGGSNYDSDTTQVDQERMVSTSPGSANIYMYSVETGSDSILRPSQITNSETTETLLAARNKQTNQVYNSGWKHFTKLCESKNNNPAGSTITMILNFLQDCFNSGLFEQVHKLTSE